MNISYHSWKSYKECPKKFYKEYIKKEPPTVPINEYFTLYGRLVEKFFELYCNIWSKKQTPTIPHSEIKKKIAIICNILESPNKNYFLNTKSEVSTEVALKTGHKITGRMDFIHKDPEKNSVLLFDGKGSSTIGKYVDNNQILFYALLYFFQYGELPTNSGFFYFRYNTLVPVLIDKEIINEFRANLSIDIKAMTTIAEHSATPSAKSCKFCNYKKGCLESLKDKATRAKPSKIKNLESDGQLIEFGFD